MNQNETLQVVFTHETGQIVTNIPLEILTTALDSQSEMEYLLHIVWEALSNAYKPYEVKQSTKTLKSISAKIISKEDLPTWYRVFGAYFNYEEKE